MAIGELVGGAFLSSLLNVLFDRVASGEVLDVLKGQKFDVGLLDKLKIKMRSVSFLLDDAEEKQITNPHVKQWLDDLKNAVYQVDDLLDEIAYEAKRSVIEAAGFQTFTDNVRNFNLLDSHNHPFQKKMEEILARIEYLAEQKGDLKSFSGEKVSLQQTRITTSLQAVDQPGSFVRNHEKEVIIDSMLLDDANEENCLGVILIWGMGGMGKTTLAKLVYNDSKVQKHFDVTAWACVSVESDEFKVIKLLLEDLDLSISDNPSVLQRKLKEMVMEKKFLIVLDDIWNECSWEILLQALKFGARGSKIILTSRNKDTASIIPMATVSHHELQKLPDDDCWNIFKKHAFKDENFDADLDVEEIGKELVKKCEGLPLAITTLGALLRSKRNVEEWEKILKSNMWNIKSHRILPILRLSYAYLPSHLKRCFAYCAIFPKDRPFEKEELVLLWMAEGFLVQTKETIRTEGKKEMKEIGDEYFDELVSKSFFQQTNANESIFHMHDLINGLAKFVSGEFCCCLEEDHACEATERTRYLSYRTLQDLPNKYKDIHEGKFLRTLLHLKKTKWWGDEEDICAKDELVADLSSSFKCLRVLSLSYHSNVVELSDSISNLKHLRYLNLSGTSIERLPDSVSKLYNLQTLILWQCHHFVELSESIGNLKFLIYLDLCGTAIKKLPETMGSLHNLQILILAKCENLTELPTNTRRLINLHHFNLEGTGLTEMPAHMGKLTKLETLSIFTVGKQSGCGIEELCELQHLRGALSIRKLENVVDSHDAWKAHLNAKKHLKELELMWDNDEAEDSGHEKDILEQMKPHTNLESLCIVGFRGTKFADWVGDCCFSKMVTLTLEECKNCFSLPPLGQLASLEHLSIKRFDVLETVGVEFYGSCSSPFQSLRSLKFEEMRQWHEWIPYTSEGEGGAFPQLQQLDISKCPNLTISLGLASHLACLENLKILDCRQLVDSLQNAPALLSVMLSDDFGFVSFDHMSLDVYNSIGIFDFLLEEVVAICYLENIVIENCDSLKYFPQERFPNLKRLRFRDCVNLEFLNALGGPLTLRDIIPSLRSLIIVECPKLGCLPIRGFAPNLESLQLRYCSNLKSLGECMNSVFPSLKLLEMQDCPEIESFPEGGLPSKLQFLFVGGCKKLTDGCIQWNLPLPPSLLHFSISDYEEEVESFPKKMFLPATLTSLRISNLQNLKSLDHEGLQHLTSLQELIIVSCPKLHSISQEGFPSSLTSLKISYLQNLKSLDHMGLQHLISLKILSITECCNLQSLTDQGLPFSLTSLRLRFLPSLQSLDCLGLQHLTSLTHLEITSCCGLTSMPKQGLPSSLSYLQISKCPYLQQRCQKNMGEDWPKIMHIPCIEIDLDKIN